MLTVRHLHIAWLVVAAALTGVVFFLGPPLSLTDLFNYLHYGRMGAVHGVNPYVVLPAAVRHDPTWHLSNWRHLLSPYGPLFTLVTYALAHLSLHAAYWAWKAIVMCSAFGVLGLVWWTAGRLGRTRQTAVALVALNPLVLVYGLGAQHNDPLMLLALVGAVALAVGGLGASRARGAWSAGAGASAVAAAALKLSAGVLAPLVVLGAARRRSALAGALAGTRRSRTSSYRPSSPDRLPAVGVQDRLVTPLSVPQFGGWLAGQGGETALVRTLCHVVLAATLAGAALAVWRRRALLPAACGTVMLVTVLTLGWTMPWYVLVGPAVRGAGPDPLAGRRVRRADAVARPGSDSPDAADHPPLRLLPVAHDRRARAPPPDGAVAQMIRTLRQADLGPARPLRHGRRDEHGHHPSSPTRR